MQKRQVYFSAAVFVKHMEILKTDLTFHRHSLKRIGSDGAGVNLAVSHSINDRVMGAPETETREVAVGVDLMFFKLPPCHQPSAERPFFNGHESFAFQVGKTIHILAVSPAENYSTEDRVRSAGAQVFQRYHPACAIEPFQSNVKGWIGQDEIHIFPFNGLIDFVKIERLNREGIAGDFVRQVLGCRPPLLQTSLDAARGQNADFDGSGSSLRGSERFPGKKQ